MPSLYFVRLECFETFCETRGQTKDSHCLLWHLLAQAKNREECFSGSYEERSNLGVAALLTQTSAMKGSAIQFGTGYSGCMCSTWCGKITEPFLFENVHALRNANSVVIKLFQNCLDTMTLNHILEDAF